MVHPTHQPVNAYNVPSGVTGMPSVQQAQQVYQQVPQPDRYALNGGWTHPDQPFDLQVGSQLCLVKKLRVEDLIKAGLVNRMDTFTTMLVQDPSGSQPSEEQQANSFMQKLADPEKFADLEDLLNTVVLMSVLQPQVRKLAEGEARQPGVAYVDQISFADKMTIFSAVFEGLGDMAPFREGQGAGMANMANEQGASGASQFPSGI